MTYETKEYRSLNCRIWVPSGKRPESGWPVLVFLHGSQEAAPKEGATPERFHAGMTAHGPLRESSGTAATQEFVVVAPQLPHPGGDVWVTQADAVEGIAEDVARDYGGNRAQTYLTGFSYGGNGVLETGVRQPVVWAALWPVEPTRPPARSADRPIWVSAGQYARNHKEAFRNVWRIQDRVPPNAAPHPKRVYEDRGFDHVRTATEAYADDNIYRWLLKHRLP